MKEMPEIETSMKTGAEEKRRHLALSDVCVCCGEPVPEGRQICWRCEHQYDADEI